MTKHNAMEEGLETLTGDFLSGGSMNGPINASDMDPEVAKAAFSSVASMSSNATSVDEAQLNVDGATSKATIDALKEALDKAESKEERESILDRIDKADERQKQNSASAGSRSANTQRGAMLIVPIIAIAAAGAAAVAGAVLLERLKG